MEQRKLEVPSIPTPTYPELNKLAEGGASTIADQTSICYLCWNAFGRVTYTSYWCGKCDRGFCSGNHGNFAFRIGLCVCCGETARVNRSVRRAKTSSS